MSATSYDSLIPMIALDAPSASDSLIVAMINKSARELCLRSSCWYEWQSVPLISGVNEYETDAPNMSSVVRSVRYIGIGNRALIPESEKSIYENRRGILDQVGEPIVYFMLDNMTIKVYPTPGDSDDGKVMNIKSAFIPTYDAKAIPSHFIDRYAEVLIDGAKANLFIMPKQAWTDAGLAQYYKSLFDTGVDKARIENEMSYSPTSIRVSARKFGSL